ncbi:glycosyltransferase family 2 protein [Wenyingzhuangia sp. chi5]|uniref:Glycosyltransferase family 2 protein n=1 Tax=Wenyingzhuangia gilva TaxID=3057677 RepID=A0ABT8VNT7_9FLAO|nr:glycosyltransferase family 2 protein [Wenyingzhuangia sp. chi5]MDO3693633.1 glycosyltransferase family 2 protein [Wenyingzhuangia sp. chi5]
MISIIIPVYNAENTIKKCVQSVFNQSVTNYEIVIVDDGSIDNSIQELKKIEEEHSCVKVFSQQNSGVTAARKKGFLESVGEYIMFLDADDNLKTNCLEILLNNFTNEIDVVNAGLIGVPNKKIWEHKDIGILNKKDYLFSLLKSNSYGYLYASLYRRSVIKEEIFNIDASIKIGEDVLMKLYICKYINKACNIKHIVYEYVDNEVSAMNTKIIHPDYYVRYMGVRNNIINDIDNTMLNFAEKTFLDRVDANKMITVFFNSLIVFDDKTYKLVKAYSAKANHKYTKLLNSKVRTKLFKSFKTLVYKTRAVLLGKKLNYIIIH